MLGLSEPATAGSGILTAAETEGNIYVQGVTVQYRVNDCQSLATSAYSAAIADARNRASAIATAMGVDIAEVPSVAESPISLFNPFASPSACNLGSEFSFPFAVDFGQLPYDPQAPAEVQLHRTILVTYPVREP
jgi:hypothetical protein